MDRFFRRVIVTIVILGIETAGVLMLRFGSPIFKFMLVAAMVSLVWAYFKYLKADRKKRINQNPINKNENEN